ncbi:MAG: xanthine dehydrogenase family protein molybdopterin-binding subunit [Treponemataceae bacterium]|nr:xanthine dehydrogenase family protein molybdopterin-binding subunit [Treponemataceae bacterium]
MSDETRPVKETPEKKAKSSKRSTTTRKTKKNSAKEKNVIDSAASFYSDLRPSSPAEELFYAYIITSPYDAGIIESIEVKELPADYIFLTAKDLPFAKTVRTLSTETPILANDKISYKGEPVALIAGTEKKRLEQLASSVEIKLKEEVPEESLPQEDRTEEMKLSEEAPQESEEEKTSQEAKSSGQEEKADDGIHIDIKELMTSLEDSIKHSAFNEKIEKRLEEIKQGGKSDQSSKQEEPAQQKEEHNHLYEKEKVFFERKFSYGDYESNYEMADYHVENTFRPRLGFSSVSEAEGAYVEYDKGTLSIYAPTLWAGHLRKNVAAALNIQEESIRIKRTIISNPGANSLWYNTILACLASIISFQTQKSVLLTSPRELSVLINTPVDVMISHKTGVRKDGRIVSALIDIKVQAGAYCPFAQQITDSMAVAAAGAYKPEAISVCVKVIGTNTFPAIAGIRDIDKLAFFAMEGQMQAIAGITKLLPIELRSLNCSEPQEENGFPIVLDSPKLIEVCDKVQKMSDLNRRYASYSQSPFTTKTASFSFPSRGIGLAAAFDGKGYYGSKLGFMKHTLEVTMEKDSSLSIKAPKPAQTIIPVWKGYASELLNIKSDQVHFEDDDEKNESSELPETITGSVYIMTQLLKKCCLGIQKLRFRQALPITVKKRLSKQKTQKWDQEAFSGTPYYSVAWGAAAAEVEIDPLLYKPKIRGIWISINAGSILNKKQSEISIKKDINDVLRHMMEGVTLSPEKMQVNFIESQEEPKQLGCIIHSILPAAITNAISHALQKTVRSVPLPFDYIYREVLPR